MRADATLVNKTCGLELSVHEVCCVVSALLGGGIGGAACGWSVFNGTPYLTPGLKWLMTGVLSFVGGGFSGLSSAGVLLARKRWAGCKKKYNLLPAPENNEGNTVPSPLTIPSIVQPSVPKFSLQPTAPSLPMGFKL